MSQQCKIIPIREGRIRRDILELKAQIREAPKRDSGKFGLLGNDPEKVCQELDELEKKFLGQTFGESVD